MPISTVFASIQATFKAITGGTPQGVLIIMLIYVRRGKINLVQ
jgi:hypothetical protein